MAPQRQPGGNSDILIARQLLYGTRVTGANVFAGNEPTTTEAALIRKIFPFTRNTLDPTGEKTRSESIVGGNSASPGILANRGGAGEWEFELLPEDAIHMLLGWFNPDSLPTNTTVDPQTIPTPVIGNIPGSGTTRRVPMDNTKAGAQAQWPGQLKITLTDAVGNGTVRINGIKRGSRSNAYNPQVFETVAVNGATATTAKNFYYQVNSLDLSGFTTYPSGIVLEYVPDTHWAELTLHTLSELFEGWSTQMRKAGSPFVGFDVIPNAFRLSIGTNIRLLMTLLASYVQEHRTLVDPNEIAYVLPDYNKANTGILAKYPKAALNFYPAFGSALVIGEPGESIADLRTRIDDNQADPTAITGFELNGTHNYEPPAGHTGDPSTGKPITADGTTRLVTAEATIFHETDTAATENKTIFWQDRFFDNIFVPIILRNYNWLSNGRQVMIEAACPNCELTAVPGLPIEGGGQVNRTLAFQANPSEGATSPDEISMRFYSKDGFKE